MGVDKNISIGNIVSWSLIVLGFVVSYARLQGNVEVVQAEALDAKKQVIVAKDQVNELRISLARIEERIKSMDSKIDDIKKYQKLASNE